MLGGQIKVALLNTAQSTSVQYTTGPRPSHLGPCLKVAWGRGATVAASSNGKMLHYLTQNYYIVDGRGPAAGTADAVP